MKTKTTYFIFLIAPLLYNTLPSCNTAPMTYKTKNSIIVEAEINKYFYYRLKEIFVVRDVMSIRYSPFYYISSSAPVEYASARVIDNKITWIINAEKPIKVTPPFGSTIIMNPGDSIHIVYLTDQPVYSGKNQQELSLLNALSQLDEAVIKPHKQNSSNASTIQDFLEWNSYLDYQLSLQLPIIESYKDKLPTIEYDYYKANIIGKTEHNRVSAFTALYDSVRRGYPGLSYSNLMQIWDSTQYKPSRQWFQSLSTYNGTMYDYYSYLQMEMWRKLRFDFTNDSLKRHDSFTHLLYTNAKQNYKGLVREKLMAFILDEQTITEMGLKNPMTLALLKDYYGQPGYPEYKKWVKDLEKKKLEREKEKEKG